MTSELPDQAATRPFSSAYIRESSNDALQFSKVLSTYLSKLSGTIPSSTLMSHKQKIEEFVEWIHADEIYTVRLIQSSANFIKYLQNKPEYSINSISGYVYALSNFVGYLTQDDPELVAIRLLCAFEDVCERDALELARKVSKTLVMDESLSGASEEEISRVISYFRQSQFGSRTHAIIEIILATKSFSTGVLNLDLEDYNRNKSLIEIETSNRFLVGQYDIVSTREVEIPKRASKALNEYLDRERSSIEGEDSEPLFTTSQGRMSASTLWRSFRRTGKKLQSQPFKSTSSIEDLSSQDNSHNRDRFVQPRDIRWYALPKLTE